MVFFARRPTPCYRSSATTTPEPSHLAITIVDMVVRQQRGAECHDSVLGDVDSSQISLVELGTERNDAARPNIRVPGPNESLADRFAVAALVGWPHASRGSRIGTRRLS